MTSIEETMTDFADADASNVSATGFSRSHAIGRNRLLIISWIAPLVVLAGWEWLAQAGWLSPQVLPAPGKVARTAFKLLQSGSLLTDLGVSLLRAAAGFAIGGGRWRARCCPNR